MKNFSWGEGGFLCQSNLDECALAVSESHAFSRQIHFPEQQ